MKREIITIENGRVSVPASSSSIWMTQYEISRMFECFVAKVRCNVLAILKTGVLDETRVCRFYYYTDGSSVQQYNLEMITALSFRIRTYNAEIFRDWLMKKAIAKTVRSELLTSIQWNKTLLN